MPKLNKMDLKRKIETVWNDRSLLKDDVYSNAVREVIEQVMKVQEKWTTHFNGKLD